MIPLATEAPSSRTRHVLRTILVVEDEDVVRTSVADFLRRCGYLVIEAGDIREAKDLLLDQRVDLLFSDINMPNREAGCELEQWTRRHYPGVNVLLTSDFPDVAADTRHLRQTIIAKPYSYSALLRRIDSVFASNR